MGLFGKSKKELLEWQKLVISNPGSETNAKSVKEKCYRFVMKGLSLS